MKKLMAILFLPAVVFLISSCNNSEEKKEKADEKQEEKITDLPASTKSKDALASFQEGLAAFDLNDGKKARAAFNKAIEQDPGFGIAYLYRANTATSAKEYADNINTGKSKMDSASNWEKMY